MANPSWWPMNEQCSESCSLITSESLRSITSSWYPRWNLISMAWRSQSMGDVLSQRSIGGSR